MDERNETQAQVSRYLPRLAIRWLADEPERTRLDIDASVVFADVSGFTALSERLARQGRIGAEILADTISSCFTRLLAAAYSNGGSLLKFGGDALLLVFTGDDHCRRAGNAVFGMRRELRSMGAIDGSGGRTRLGMSVGIHTGRLQLFLLGGSHRELVVTGTAASEVVRMEAAADKGEIVVSAAVARELGPACVGVAKGAGFLLRREPRGLSTAALEVPARAEVDVMLPGLPAWLRDLALAGADDPQHRHVVVGFLKFSGVDALFAGEGAAAVAAELDQLIRDAQLATEQHGVFLLGSDVDEDGGKLILAGGAPTTAGDDEQRVLLAARQILERPRRLDVRIGVHGGPTFAGDIGPAYRRTYTVMGDTVNLAARIMARAEAGTVLASDAVLARSGADFELRPVEPFLVKGKSLPVHASVVGRLRAGRADDVDVRPLIGRDAELDVLLTAWASASRGSGGVVVVAGEPGIGKSRLTSEAARRSCAPVLRVVCEPYATATAYTAARQLLLQSLGPAATVDDVDAVRRRLDEVLVEHAPSVVRWAPLIGRVLGVDLPVTTAVAELDERFVRDRLEEAVVEVLATLTSQPTFVYVEDAHLMDEASASLFSRLVPRLAGLPLLIVVCRRDVPGGLVLDPGGAGAASGFLTLVPLPDNAAIALLDTLSRDGATHDPVAVAALVARSGGNPLFLAELVAAADQTESTSELPDSLEAVILARIDSLALDDRSLLRKLSVFGGTFSHRLAQQVLGASLPGPHDAVWTRLAGFLDLGEFRRMSFRHTLLMDGAYNSLPFKVRESLHATVAETIERTTGAGTADRADALSLHFYRAHRYDAAWRYSLVAAEKAKTAYANAEVAQFLDRAIDCARRGADVPTAELLTIAESLGDTYRRMGRLDAAEQSYRQARALTVADPESLSRMMVKRAGVRQQAGAFPQAMRWLAQADACLAQLPPARAQAQRARVAVARASVAKEQSRGAAIIKWSRIALHLAARSRDVEVLAHASFLLDLGHVIEGNPERAVNSAQALAWYEELGSLWGQGAVLNNWGGHAYWAGRWDEAVAYYLRGRAAFERIGDVCNAALGLDNVGEIRSDQGRYDEAEALFAEALNVRRRVDDKAKTAYAMSNWGRLLTRRGHVDEALETLTAAKVMSSGVGQAWDVSEATLRILECLTHGGRVDRAVDLARSIADRGAGLTPGQSAMLHRLLGFVLLQAGDVTGADAAVSTSLGDAERGRAAYELALSLRARGHVEDAFGRDPVESFTRAQSILDGLGVVQVAEPAALANMTAFVPSQLTADRAEPLMPS
jgi:class 3 adenylate cyclase/tetratricopeptide (TPR) repeat protein